MSNKRIEWGQELISSANELSEAGVPGIGLLGKFAQSFCDRRLKKRFEKFLEEAHVDNDFIEEILANEEYSDCLYGTLETVRRTHLKLGLSALARIYHQYWKDPRKIIPATRALAEISDAVVLAFVRLYREIEPPKGFLVLYYAKGEERYFHEDYAEAVDRSDWQKHLSAIVVFKRRGQYANSRNERATYRDVLPGMCGSDRKRLTMQSSRRRNRLFAQIVPYCRRGLLLR